MACECAICKNNKPFAFPKEIIDAALDGELVLFCGAGISTESKNVLPYSFYTSIKNELDVKDESVSFSDLMQLYCNQPNGRKKLLKRIRERFNYISSFPELERQAMIPVCVTSPVLRLLWSFWRSVKRRIMFPS